MGRYEYEDLWGPESGSVGFDAYMIPTSDLEAGMHRLLEVDNRTLLPFGCQIRFLITSVDVLHSRTVPAIGVKADAVPGRLNQVKFITQRPGLFYGQCSEICGANHSFIPIVLESINPTVFLNWIINIQEA